ncbi:MJ0042-type zinc finger domain-containing protein, partial [Pseudomonas sp. Pseusp97]|uniref:MJ0042-type zinc finger domain-containing protein n=1 Tax=Pseudomonas sp. Pseusp97 TaxID=3243065 RepID=UPI0039A51646
MSDSFITQCPHCQTRFRVNAAQLGAASGAVRCGTCLKVFSAPQNMVGEPTQAATPAVAAPAPVKPPVPAAAPAP